MYIDDATARQHGYAGAPEAVRALLRARRWLVRHKGKRPPKHVRETMKMAAELQREQGRYSFKIKRAMSLRWLRMRSWIGAVPLENPWALTVPLYGTITFKMNTILYWRRWLRWTFRLYMSEADMALHTAHCIPPATRVAIRQASQAERDEVAARLNGSIRTLYSLGAARNPLYSQGPKQVADRVARTAIAYVST